MDDSVPEPRNPWSPLVPFVIFSLILHLLILGWLAMQWQEKKGGLKKSPVVVKLVTLPKRIADIPQPAHEERPRQAEQQALYDQTAREQTVRSTPPGPQGPLAAGQKPAQGQQQTLPSPPPKTSAASKKSLTKKSTQPSYVHSPQESSLLARAGGSPVEDYFPDYKRGDRTYINTMRNLNIAYFAELKGRYRLAFNPGPALRPHLLQISRGQIEVVLGVSVKKTGVLAEVVVLRSSGLEDYDREGLRTVKVSAPYSQVPAEFLAKDGKLHMAWTFTTYL